MEIARDLLPPGMELAVVDPAKPEFYEAAVDADYYFGSPRTGIGNEFFHAAPKLKLVQFTSAGYDRVDIEAARKAKVPMANNGGANSVAVFEHAVMLMLAVEKKLVWHHLNVVAGKRRSAESIGNTSPSGGARPASRLWRPDAMCQTRTRSL